MKYIHVNPIRVQYDFALYFANELLMILEHLYISPGPVCVGGIFDDQYTLVPIIHALQIQGIKVSHGGFFSDPH